MKNSLLIYLTMLCWACTISISYAQDSTFFKGRWFKPMPFPEYKATPSGAEFEAQKLVTKVKGEKPVIRPATPDTAQQSQQVEGLPGIEWKGNGEQPLNLPDNFTPLSLVSDPTVYPFRTSVKIFMTFPSGGTFVCSGALIDPKHVLTAGHCVHGQDEGGWVDELTVYPAYDAGMNDDFGGSDMVQATSWAGWTVNESWEHDMALIELDRPVGGIVGWMGYGYNSDNNFYLNNTFHNPGYPANTPYNGEYMYYWYGDYDYLHSSNNILYHYNQAYGGQSGSNSYYKDANNNRYVHAVLSHGNNQHTGHTRLTSGKFSDIQSIIQGNIPGSPDLVPMAVQASPTTIQAGNSFSDFSFFVHNYSTNAFNGAVNVSFYISTNDYISTSDELMGTRNWSNISIDPRNTKTLQVVNNPIAVPGDVSAGDYYVGVIINISDADNGNNNTVYYDTYPVTVTCNTPGSPTVSASGSTNLCPGQNVTLTASNVCSGCTVKWSNGQTGTSITVSSSGTYKAKNENGCGKISSYSNSISVSSASLPTAPTISANGSLMLCNGQSVSLTATNVCSGCSVNWSNGQSGTSITVSTQGNFTASYTNSCGQGPESNTISTTIGSAPSAPSISATGPTSLCNGQSVTLNATNVCNGCTVNWSDGQSGTSITVSNPGNYTATNTSSCGTSKPSLSISIALGTVPVAPVLSAEGGNQQLCPGQSLELQASNVCTDCDIVWSTGQTTESITITSQGVFTAVAQNSCGVSNTSNSLTIIPGVAPSTPVIIAEGSTTLCNNQSVAITASNVCPACTVNWSNGQSGSTLSASSPGVYTATYTNSCGTSNASNSIEVITGGQFIPEIQVNNICYLAAPNGSAYQWYLNGAAIAGATNQFYIAVNSGYYVMSMTSLGGCQGVSDPVFAQACLSSTREELWEVDIKLFPNPASENLHIQLTNGVSISNFSFELIEPDGRIATTMQKTNMLNTEIVQISIGHLPVGIYFYRIRSDQGMLTGKVMIEH